MPYRKLIFTNQEIYHIFNRGIAQAPIFLSFRDHQRFTNLIDYYRFNPNLSFSHYNRLDKETRMQYLENLKKAGVPIVEILAFCLMSNHYHLLLKQIKDDGIKLFVSNLQNGYAKYFNTRHERSGSLFQSMFKAIRVETDEQLLHLSRYIHLNPSTSFLIEPENLPSYQWSSLPDYLGKSDFKFINPGYVLGLLKNEEEYKNFILDQADYQRKLNKIKHMCLE